MKRTGTPPSRTDPARGVEMDTVYPQPPEQVWRALTDPRRLAQWLLPNDFAPRLGHRFTFRGRRGPAIHCEVIALEEARHLSYTWRRGSSEPLSVVTWTLEPAPGGATRVRLTHSGLQASAFGPWPAALRHLPHVLDPGRRVSMPTAAPRPSLLRSCL